MRSPNLGETQPTQTNQKRRRILLWSGMMFLAFAMIFVVFLAGAWGGYRAGIAENQSIQSTAAVAAIQEQYVLGVSDLQAGRYDLARQRFEYVLELDPDFPGVTEKLAEARRILYATSTPIQVGRIAG